jgi:hypothetical protein
VEQIAKTLAVKDKTGPVSRLKLQPKLQSLVLGANAWHECQRKRGASNDKPISNCFYWNSIWTFRELGVRQR